MDKLFSTLTIDEVKNQLRARNLPTIGTDAELFYRFWALMGPEIEAHNKAVDEEEAGRSRSSADEDASTSDPSTSTSVSKYSSASASTQATPPSSYSSPSVAFGSEAISPSTSSEARDERTPTRQPMPTFGPVAAPSSAVDDDGAHGPPLATSDPTMIRESSTSNPSAATGGKTDADAESSMTRAKRLRFSMNKGL